MAEIDALISLCTERAESYGALRQSSTTAIALDRAAEALRTLQARVVELEELIRSVPEIGDTLTRQEFRDARGNWRSFIDQFANWQVRTLTSQEFQHHG